MTETFDSSAWIEYFAGTKLGLKVKNIIDGSDLVYTPSIGLMEIKHKYQKENKKWKRQIDFICDRSLIIDLNSEISLFAADIKKNFGLYSIDAIIYATAQKMRSILITKDKHFMGLKDTFLLE